MAVERRWPGETFVILASGPSLTLNDVDACRGKARVVAINHGGFIAPWADVLYACDGAWWKRHDGAPSFQGLKFGLTLPPIRWMKTNPISQTIHFLKPVPCAGIDTDPTRLCTGGGQDGAGNSGHQAIGLAVHLGARRILLLGYDMHADPKGKRNWHQPDTPTRSPYREFQRGYPKLSAAALALGVEIVNCSRQTALTCFPRQQLDQALSVAVAA